MLTVVVRTHSSLVSQLLEIQTKRVFMAESSQGDDGTFSQTASFHRLNDLLEEEVTDCETDVLALSRLSLSSFAPCVEQAFVSTDGVVMRDRHNAPSF